MKHVAAHAHIRALCALGLGRVIAPPVFDAVRKIVPFDVAAFVWLNDAGAPIDSYSHTGAPSLSTSCPQARLSVSAADGGCIGTLVIQRIDGRFARGEREHLTIIARHLGRGFVRAEDGDQSHTLALLRGAYARGLAPQMTIVALALARGKTNKEIAAEIGVSPNTAAYHIKAIFDRLGVNRRADVAPALLAKPVGTRSPICASCALPEASQCA